MKEGEDVQLFRDGKFVAEPKPDKWVRADIPLLIVEIGRLRLIEIKWPRKIRR